MADLLVRGGKLVTQAAAGSVSGGLYAVGGRIAELPSERTDADVVVDATGCLVLPGLVQAHVHLCQTLFRGIADDMDVVEWLRFRIWPLEQGHDPASIRASAALAAAELLLSGTTSVLTIETTHHTEHVFAAARDLGIRATIGPALMDRWEPGTEMIGQSTEEALNSVETVLGDWHGSDDGRLRVALCPRGPRNCTPELWKELARLSEQGDLRIHTHAGENREQAELLSREPGGRDLHALESYGVLGTRLVMAHCVWLDEGERELLRRSGAHVCHCPSANLKLASGLAPIPEYLEDGVNIALGADGAACNNNLDVFTEMRLAGLIHRPRRGPTAVSPEAVLWMATMGGARALGLEHEVGSLEVGKRADVVTVRMDRLHSSPPIGSEAARLLFSARASDIDTVIVDGRVLVRGGRLMVADESEIRATAEEQARIAVERAGIRSS